MSKEKYRAKECIEVIKANGVYNPNIQKYFDELEEILTEYEAIKNSNTSEALDRLYEIIDYYNEPQYDVCENSFPNEFKDMWKKELNTIKQALLKAQEQEKELKSEINTLFSYMEFAKLFFEIFNLNYSNETFTLSLMPNEQYNIEDVDLKICLIKEDADKILKVAELLEKEDKSE